MEWEVFSLRKIKSFMVWYGWLFTGLALLSVLFAGPSLSLGHKGLYLIFAAALSATSMLVFIPPDRLGRLLPLSIPAYLVFIHSFLSLTGGAASPFQPLYLLPIMLASLLFRYKGAVLSVLVILASLFSLYPAGGLYTDFILNELPFTTTASLLAVMGGFISTTMTEDKEALKRDLGVMKVLHDTDMAILSSMERKEVLKACLGNIKRLIIDADYASIATFDQEEDIFRLEIASLRDTLDVRQEVIPCDSTILRRAASSKAAIYSPEIKAGDLLCCDSEFRENGIRSLLVVPLIAKGSFLGTMNLGSLKIGRFSREEIGLAERYALQIAIAIDNSNLYERMRGLFINTVVSLSSVIDAKSPWTLDHSERVADYTLAIARDLGLDEAAMQELRLAVLLHDIGKIGISDAILNKPLPLSDEEKAIMERHPVKGVAILEPIRELRDIIPVIRHHHERWDGTGYPDGICGNMIPLEARILSVADAFEAMMTDRPYRTRLTLTEAKEELLRCSGSQFDPQVVDVFVAHLSGKG